MARTRTASGRFTRGSSSPQTIVVRQTAPAQKRPAATRRRRRRSSGGGASANITRDALAGGVYGLAERMAQDWDLPEIPFLGRKGTIALALYLLRNQHPMIAEAARAGIIISSYELIAEGKITGE